MAANTTPIFVENITAKGATWTNSDAANTKKTISPTIGADGARIHQIALTSTDTVNVDFRLYLNDGTNDFLIGAVVAAAGAGNTSAAAAASVLGSALLPWVGSDYALLIPAGHSLKAENVTQLAAGKTATIVCIGGDY